ncbi:MAG: GTPase Era [Ignavibacteriae bacterium]|nr:MAG: GTPase Era [Ignavibacteriota bacterium]
MIHKSGYAAILGLPNAGKSTLLNTLLGQKISITNLKPQTTRKRILGILSEENFQVIFIDTPGILDPAYLLQEKMMHDVKLSGRDADVIVLLLDVETDPAGNKALNNSYVKENILKAPVKKILVLNKVDLLPQEKVKIILEHFNKSGKFDEIIPLSALQNFNTQKLLQTINEYLPEGPKFYPDDIVAEQNERFFVTELIREIILEQYREEVPYSCEVLIAEFKERENSKDYISAEIVVEKESQKAIIIGKQGAAIKILGQAARESIEEFLEREVFLELRVKVRKKWRSSENFLKSFGYTSD